MRIGIIGAGRIGVTAARLFAKAGHDLALCNSRGPESLDATIDEIDEEVGKGRVHARMVSEAAEHGDVVLLAVPFRAADDVLRPEWYRGRIVIDAMNPYVEGGALLDLGDDTSSGIVARRLSGARIVKAFNTIHWTHLAEQGDTRLPMMQRRVIPLAGDDTDAKHVVAGLIEQIGFAPLDMGALEEGGRAMQPGAPVYNENLTLEQASRLSGSGS